MVTPVISDGQLKFKTEAESTESLAPLDAFMLMLAVQRLKPYYSSREQGPQFEKLHQEILSLQNQGYSPADVFRFEYAVRQRYEEDGTSLDAINFDLRLRYLMTPQLQRAAAPTPLMAQQAPRFGQGNNLPRALTRRTTATVRRSARRARPRRTSASSSPRAGATRKTATSARRAPTTAPGATASSAGAASAARAAPPTSSAPSRPRSRTATAAAAAAAAKAAETTSAAATTAAAEGAGELPSMTGREERQRRRKRRQGPPQQQPHCDKAQQRQRQAAGKQANRAWPK